VNEKPVVLEIIDGGKVDLPIISPKPARGGPPGYDWLRDLQYGDRFLAKRHMDTGPRIPCFGIAQIIPEAILLADMQPTGMMSFDWVDSKIFSGMYKLICVLPKPDEEAGTSNDKHHLSGPADRDNYD
jgi:hypothetical protein